MSDENPFVLEAQNGIFNLFFQLLTEYSHTLPPEEAFEKAIGWLDSLTNSLRQKHEEIIQSKAQAQQKMRAES